MKKIMYLQLFEDGGGAGSGNQGGNAGDGNGNQGSTGGGTYSYEQAEEIATARAQRAEQAALRSYFQQQGMTEDQVRQALADYKEKQKANQPNVDQIQKDLAEARRENAQMKNEKFLSGKGVKAEDLDYVAFKISKKKKEKTNFEKAAEKYLKENPRFVSSGNTYRISTSASNSSEGSGGSVNTSINDKIRAAMRR